MLGELQLQLGGSVQRLPALLLRQPLVHLPEGTERLRQVVLAKKLSLVSTLMFNYLKTQSAVSVSLA